MAKIILFRDVNFGKAALVVTAGDPRLKSQDFNDSTSSLIVVSGTWKLYQDDSYKTTDAGPWTVSENGGPFKDGTYPDFRDWKGKNDSISSLKPA